MIVHNKCRFVGHFGAVFLLAFAAFPATAHQVESTQPVVINSTPVTPTGTVAELIVKNQVTGVTLRYLGLKLDQGGSYALSGNGLDTLINGSRINAVGTLAGSVFNVTLFSVVAQPQSLGRMTALGQSEKTLSGTLGVYHKDFFEQGRGEYGLAVRDASDVSTPLNVAAIPDSLQIGMLVSADGKVAADGSSMDVSTITILAPAPAKLNDVAAATVTNNVLVLPIKFADSPASDPFTVAAINTEFQTKVAPYYQEVSYGQQLLNITVANSGGNWLNAGAATPGGCDFTTIGTLADAAATAAGYNVNNYPNRYYVMPSIGCGWAGLAYVGWGRAWSNGVNALWVYGHELGHNFGLWHAGSVSCGAQVLGGSCGVSEYGDPFDVMGNIRQMHFNAMQKAVLNWIPSTSVKIHSSGTQTYQLSPLETGGQSTYAVKIPTSNTKRTYWVEFRQPIGFDSGLSSLPNLGAQIRVSGPQFDFVSGSDDTEILDMTPGTGGGFDDAALLAGQTYVDSTTGVTINVISATAGSSGLLTVSVAMGGQTATSTALASSGSPSLVGVNVTFTATVAGASPTGTVAFTDGGSAISGCSAVTLPAGAANSKIATCTTSSLTQGTHSIVATYSGDAGNNGSTSVTWSQVVNNPGKVPSSTALSSSGSPSLVGANVTFTATVTGTAPSGSVAFTDGGTPVTGCGALALPTGAANSKIATCSTSSLTQGTHSIVATYVGDSNNNGSASSALSQLVDFASLVDHYYQAILGRAPDVAGKAYWESEVARTQTLGIDVKEAYMVLGGVFFNSAEYLSRNTSNTQYVTDLYNAFFNRAPDAGGLAYWVGQLGSGQSRSIVMYSFMFSSEFNVFMTGLFGNTTSRAEVYAIVDFYRGILNRLPDNSGFAYWLPQFRAAQCSGAGAVYSTVASISSQFIASGEYVGRNRNNTDYVGDLYYAFLRRGGDLPGVTYWINRLNTGAETRDQMRTDFSNSPEFSGRINAIIAAGCLS
jgi:Bacterial Ig-like domain (group 3)/Domain of unknown function (DUF4214)/Gametolysin peptidase M11